jgi:hypothetical protein
MRIAEPVLKSAEIKISWCLRDKERASQAKELLVTWLDRASAA